VASAINKSNQKLPISKLKNDTLALSFCLRTWQEFSLFFEDAYRFQFTIPIEY
jgi:hypothetical protein